MAEESLFTSKGGDFIVTDKMKTAYDKNGYILVKGLLSKSEIEKVRDAIVNNKVIPEHVHERSDSRGKTSKICLWNHPGADIPGVMVRMEKTAGTMEQLMGGDEIYHYHTKLIMKDAQTGGAHLWHQDYGYWYNNGNLLPDMGSMFIPLDVSNKENGCLQVLRGSHQMGRVHHGGNGEQLEADPERVEQALKFFEHLYVEMEPGDVLFFHCNLLHSSSQNHSNNRRWVLVPSYNKRSNSSYNDHHHPRYTPMTKVKNSALINCAIQEEQDGKWFMTFEEDHSADLK